MTTDTMFRHDALLYAGLDDFVARTAAFVRAGLSADEAVGVAVIEPRASALRDALGEDADHVTWIDMAEVGRNPARIIPAWVEWTQANAARGFRGIGEPIWAGRSDDEIVECVHHEALLNMAFADVPWQLLCPYDMDALNPDVIGHAHRTHPRVLDGEAERDGRDLHAGDFAATLAGPALPAVPARAERLDFRSGELAAVRSLVRRSLSEAPKAHVNHAILAVSEIAGNSVVHGGGGGSIAVWAEGTVFVCEIRDAGRVTDPLAGRRCPLPDQDGGRGLWMVNRICDLVQIRSGGTGTTIRLRLNGPATA